MMSGWSSATSTRAALLVAAVDEERSCMAPDVSSPVPHGGCGKLLGACLGQGPTTLRRPGGCPVPNGAVHRRAAGTPLDSMPRVPSSARLRPLPLVLCVAVATFVAVAALSTRTAPDTYPVADTAATSIATLQAGRGNLAVGSYSRFGWN